MSADARAGAGADAASEIRATREAAGLFDYSSRGKVIVSGADCVEFLQGMLTSDVAALTAGRAQRSAIVNAMGKMIANLLLLKRGNDVLLETPPGRAPVVVETLAKYVITENVEAADRTSDSAILSVQGPRSAAVLREAIIQAPGAAIPEDAFTFSELAWRAAPLVVLRHDRFRLPGYDVWVPERHAASLREAILRVGSAHGLAACGDDARETLRITAGRPAWSTEITEDCFPGEVGLSWAVSVKKGCYIGQEVLSRIHHMGHVNRVLVRARVEASVEISPATRIVAGGRDVGGITSVAPLAEGAGRALLAILRREVAKPRTPLVVALAGGTLRPLELVEVIS